MLHRSRNGIQTLDWKALKEIFEQARSLTGAARERYLEEVCAHDPAIKSEIDLLLAKDEGASDYFESLAAHILPADLRRKAAKTSTGRDPRPSDLLIGTRVGHYRIESRLGEGGMGVVYKARHATLGHPAALKFLHAGLKGDRSARERLRYEAKAAFALDHPNICTIYDIGETESGRIYVAMAFYDGETLKERLSRGPLGVRFALDLAVQVCEGLIKAHRAGIAHLDIKPANIMITRDGVAKILDFGVARVANTIEDPASSVLGTPAYMSPEQIRGTGADHQADIWSLGVVLHEMIAGRHPISSALGNKRSVVEALVNPDPVLPDNPPSGYPAELWRITARCLEKRPELRYGSASALFTDLYRTMRSEAEEAGTTRVFISYEHRRDVDRRVAEALIDALGSEHDVVTAGEGVLGVRWIEKLEADLKSSQFLIVLLSKDSVFSEMVVGEMEMASRLSQEPGRGPVIIPIRIAYDGPLSYPLEAYLTGRRPIVWNSDADTSHVISRLSRTIYAGAGREDASEGGKTVEAITGDPDLEIPSAKAHIGQPISQLYLEREEDKTALQAILQDGVTITIKGGRQMGKSSLLGRLVAAAVDSGKRAAVVDFHLFEDALMRDGTLFFKSFCAKISEELGLENQVDRYWTGSLSNPHRCTRYFARYLIPSLPNQPIFLALDEVERLFDAPFRLDFFGMLRSWHNDRAFDRIWRHLNVVLVTSTEPYELSQTPNLSPFNVGRVVTMKDLTEGEVILLNARHGSPLSDEDASDLYRLVGGHPYLVRRALYLIGSGAITYEQLARQSSDRYGPFDDHLRYHLFRLRNQPDLQGALERVIRTHECDDDELFWRLEGAGLVRQEGDHVYPRSPLYADYFEQHLGR